MPGPWRWRLVDAAPLAAPRWRQPSKQPPAPAAFAEGAPLVAVDPGQPLWCEWPGLLPLIDPAPGPLAHPRTVDGNSLRWPTARLTAFLDGRVVVLDPAGGSDDPDGTGPLGLRGSDVNLATARSAAAMLRGAGAVVQLTRTGEAALTPSAKVALAADAGAHLFVTIGRAAEPDVVGVRHHIGSGQGAALAAALARACATLPVDGQTVEVTEGSEYLLRQTHCPALTLTMPAIATTGRELVLDQAAWTAAEARAILLGLAGAGSDPAWPAFDPSAALALIAAHAEGPVPDAVTAVVVDGQFPWRPCPRLPGSAGAGAPSSLTSGTGPGLPPGAGRHILELRTVDAWQVWLIEPDGHGTVATRLAGGPRGEGSVDDPTHDAGY